MITIGRFGKPHGLDGTLSGFVDDVFLQDLFQARVLFLGDPERAMPYFVESVRHGNRLLIKLEETDSREAALALAGKPIFLREEDISPKPDIEQENEEAHFSSFAGSLLIDKDSGPIGVVEQVLMLPGHVAAQVNYNGREVLIPLHESLLLVVREGEILMDLPAGLLDL